MPNPPRRRAPSVSSPGRFRSFVVAAALAASAVVVTAVSAGSSAPALAPTPAGPSAPAPGTVDEAAAERAAREIAAARTRANEAADRLWAAQSELELLREEQARLADRQAELQAAVDVLQEKMESIAVGRFVSAGSAGIPLLTDVRSPNDRLQAEVFIAIIADSGATTIDDYDAARTELRALQREAVRAESRSLALQAQLETMRQTAEADVTRLRALEEQRLADEAVQRALEAQRREEARRAEEQRQAEEAARLAADQSAAELAPAPASASGGSVGGRTGGGGGGSNPASFAGEGFVDRIVCPVVGASAWGDTWGAPRSGGRRHQGVDMIAPVGTPLQAVISGTVEHRTNLLGGITVSLLGDNGHRYYYAHLVSWEGEPGRVAQGQVIGYVGETGNAYGTPHLHFEIRPNGGIPVNPTPSVAAAGC